MLKKVIVSLLMLTLTIFCGCAPSVVQVTERIHLFEEEIVSNKTSPIGTALKIPLPKIQSERVEIRIGGDGQHIRTLLFQKRDLQRSFQDVLYRNISATKLYNQANKDEHKEGSHTLFAEITIGNLSIGNWATSEISIPVKVDYSIKSGDDEILTTGNVEVEVKGAGKYGFPNEVYIDIVKDSLSKAAAEVTSRLLENETFKMLAAADARSHMNQEEIFSENVIEARYDQQANKTGDADVTVLPVKQLGVGKYIALVIGNNDYQHLPKLVAAQNDANSVATLLEAQYNFSVQVIENGTRLEILRALDKLKSHLTPEDKMLIYYAGHGYYDKESNRGYWLPIDAHKDTSANWISNADISDRLRAFKSKKVLIVADSCFSGSMTRGLKIQQNSKGYYKRLLKKQSRTVMTSGGMEPVEDQNGGKNSVFASAFLTALNDNEGIIDGTTLFTQIRRPVILNAQQTPEYGDIRFAGHEGGDFVFIRGEKVKTTEPYQFLK